MFKANLWFAGFHQGLTVKQNWAEVTDLRKYIWKKNVLEEMRKKNKKNLNKKMSHSMTHYCTAIFGSQKPLGTADWTCNLVSKSITTCGSQVCSSRAHCRDYLHLCFKNTGCWVGLAWQENGSRGLLKGQIPLWLIHVLTIWKADIL